MFMFLATVIARMLAVFVRLVAHVLFAFWKAAAFVRARLAVRLVLGTVATVLVTSFIAAVAVLIVLSSAPRGRALRPWAGRRGEPSGRSSARTGPPRAGGSSAAPTGRSGSTTREISEARNADASALVNVSGATITANSIVGAAGAGGSPATA